MEVNPDFLKDQSINQKQMAAMPLCYCPNNWKLVMCKIKAVVV